MLGRAGPLVDANQAWSAETGVWIVLVLQAPEVGDVPANEELPLPVVVRVVKAISGRPLAVADRL